MGKKIKKIKKWQFLGEWQYYNGIIGRGGDGDKAGKNNKERTAPQGVFFTQMAGKQSTLNYIQKNLHIQDKRGKLVAFRFNKAQLKLYGEIERQRKEGRPVRIIILKARQMGFSTAAAALFYERSARNANTNSMIVAHKAEASQNIFAKTKLFYETVNIPFA